MISDELIVECLQENAEEVVDILRSSMTQAIKLEVYVRTHHEQDLFITEALSRCIYLFALFDHRSSGLPGYNVTEL